MLKRFLSVGALSATLVGGIFAAAPAVGAAADTKAPSAVQGVTAYNPGPLWLEALSWKASTDNIGVVGYRVTYGGRVINVAAAPNCFTNGYCGIRYIEGLTQGTTYNVTVAAYDAAGNLGRAGTTSFTTPIDTQAPTTPPWTNAVQQSHQMVSFTWAEPADNYRLCGYTVFVDGKPVTNVPANSTGLYIYDGVNPPATGSSAIRMDGLLAPGSTHTFEVQAFDAVGLKSGRAGKSITVFTDFTAPTAITNLKVSQITSTSAHLSWDTATDNSGKVWYDVRWTGGTGGAAGTTVPYQDLPGMPGFSLVPNTTYTVTVQAVDYSTNRGTSATISFKTLP